jgi:hypothetical protein
MAGRVALKTPEAWLSMTGTVAQNTPDYSHGTAALQHRCTHPRLHQAKNRLDFNIETIIIVF